MPVRDSHSLRFAILLAAILVLVGRARLEPSRIAAAPPAGERSVFVVAHSYHAGLIVRASDVPPDAWPARSDFADAEYLELGWGEREYYTRDDPGVWLGLRALRGLRLDDTALSLRCVDALYR